MASQSVKREDFVNPHAYNMRTDYYVVSPNMRMPVHNPMERRVPPPLIL